ncbi:MAG: hypothetical protein IJP92_06910, partial [Lachnospiraceae bacterium]|nr:hypothetical protein [Lachnospiraceae bacterium]
MKAIKRHLATVLAAIMIFTTIGNAYVSAKASGDTLDTFGEDAGTHEITVTDQGEAVPPAEVTETAPPEETTPPAPEVTETPVVIEETPVIEDTTPVEPELPPTDVQEPVITDQTDVPGPTPEIPETEITEEPETEVVNEDASVVVVNYDAGVGGTVDYASESFRSDDTQIQLYGSQAIPDAGYIFKNWIRTETGEVVTTEDTLIPDSDEVQWILGHTADAGGEISVSYTAQFVAVASEYEEILPNIIRVKVYVSEGAFDREVELVVKELDNNTQEYQDAEQALQDAEKEYEGMMAFDIHFADVETGEEIEPAGPVRVEFDILRRAINNTINQTDAIDQITSEDKIEVIHIVETEDTRTGETQKSVETIADSAVTEEEGAQIIAENENLEDPNAGLDNYGEQVVVPVAVETDRNDNVTEIKIDAVMNGFSIFVITTNKATRRLEEAHAGAHMIQETETGGYDARSLNGKRYKDFDPDRWLDITFKATGNSKQIGDLGKGRTATWEIDGIQNATPIYRIGPSRFGYVKEFVIMDYTNANTQSETETRAWVAAIIDDNNGGEVYATYINEFEGQTEVGNNTFHFITESETPSEYDAYVYRKGTGN